MKREYEKLSIKISNISVKDVITTSGFDGPGQSFIPPASGSGANLPDSMV